MPEFSHADHSTSPPQIHIPRDYNAAVDLIERNLRPGRAEKPAYIDDAGSYTYAELANRIDRFVIALRSLGVQMEQRVLLCLLDTIDFPVAFLGCIKAGVVPIAVNTLLSRDDLAYVLNDSRACTAIVSDALLPSLAEPLAQGHFLRHLIVSGRPADGYHHLSALLEAANGDRISSAPTTCDDACFWLYSSGSTGAPKGTVHAHSSLIQTAELYARALVGYREDDVVFSASKLPFAYGLGNSLSFPLAVGATAVLMAERPTPTAIIERLHRHRPTIFCTIPTAYAALLACPELPAREQLRLRVCTSAGEALPSQVGERWNKHFGVPILDGIGSTEMLHIFISNTPSDICYGTTGKVVPGYESRLVGEDGADVALGEAGELLVRGPTRAIHYWNNRTRTSTTFCGEWTHTGDKFHLTEDGHYIYEGRMDDMLKVSGLYVSPFEVESALMQHEAILEAAVVGRQDAQQLTKVCAFVVLKPGCAVMVQELQQHVKALLAPHKYPRSIEFVSELPKTATGKIQRFKLRQQTLR
jgi:benzoate-CoA ligase